MLPGFILNYRKQHPRLTNHYGLALVSLLACVTARLIGGSDQPIFETISLGTGYVALLLVLLTLVIGPINMLKKRKNPVNMMFRRDAGIWAGITAILHIISSFTLYFGGNLLLYFFADNGSGLSFSFDLFYLSDYVGLIAGLVILFLMVLSNNYFLKMFKGPKWKQFQRFNYLLFVVALLHTLGQQLTNSRNLALSFGVIALSALVVVAQSIGFVVYRKRDQQRKAASTVSTAPRTARVQANSKIASGHGTGAGPTALPVPAISRNLPLQPAYATAPIDKNVGRRRFLLVAGTVVLSGVVGGVSAKVIAKSNETSLILASNPTGETNATTASGTTSSVAQTTADVTGTSTATVSSGSAAVTNTGSTSTAASAAPTTSGAVAATTGSATTAAAATSKTAATSTAAATATTAPSGTVLANVSNLAAGKALAVTTPDTKASAFVIHRQDGSVACFSGICTHEPVKLTFNEAQQYLYCPKHGVPFDIQTGAPERGPARTALAKYNVTLNSQGQIIYG